MTSSLRWCLTTQYDQRLFGCTSCGGGNVVLDGGDRQQRHAVAVAAVVDVAAAVLTVSLFFNDTIT